MSTDSRGAAVLAGLVGIRGWKEDLYRDLHQHPELSRQEHRTAGIVAHRLRAAGFSVHEGVGGSGVVGVLENGDGPAVLLWADMDALPIREATDLRPVADRDLEGNGARQSCRSHGRAHRGRDEEQCHR